MYDGQVKYSPMCNENGGVVDDLLVYRRKEDDYLIVVNAANRHKDVEWIKQHIVGEVEFQDISDELSLLALQGKTKILYKLTVEENLPGKDYTFKENILLARFLVLFQEQDIPEKMGLRSL